MSLAPSRPAEEVEGRLESGGFRPGSVSALDPAEVAFCSSLHCQRCREPELECRAYVRLSATGEESRAVGVCRRCVAAEVMPRSRATRLLRRADEHAGIAGAAAVAAMAGLLVLASVARAEGLQIALFVGIAAPVLLLAYLARNGPGGGGADFGGPGI